MQEELEALKPVLSQSQQDTEILMLEIQEKLPGVEVKRTEVQGDTAVAETEAAECLKGKQSVETDLSVAMPALNAAIKVYRGTDGNFLRIACLEGHLVFVFQLNSDFKRGAVSGIDQDVYYGWDVLNNIPGPLQSHPAPGYSRHEGNLKRTKCD